MPERTSRSWKFSLVMQTVVLLISISSGVAGEVGNFSKEQVCKAAVATMMGRDPKIVKVKKTKDGIVYLSYRRPDDGKLWAYRCKLEGDKVIWASDNPDSLGRWRTHPADERINYRTLQGGTLLRIEERYGDGSSTSKEFSLKQLRK